MIGCDMSQPISIQPLAHWLTGSKRVKLSLNCARVVYYKYDAQHCGAVASEQTHDLATLSCLISLNLTRNKIMVNVSRLSRDRTGWTSSPTGIIDEQQAYYSWIQGH